ncbi:hypothetical protein COOONC_01777 [Cooperia oncophora]
MPAPTDINQLRSFLGLINFYGNFVKDLHNLRAPLDALTKKDAVYKWTQEWPIFLRQDQGNIRLGSLINSHRPRICRIHPNRYESRSFDPASDQPCKIRQMAQSGPQLTLMVLLQPQKHPHDC